MANLRIVFFIIGIILLLGYIFFGGNSPDSKIPGGGFGTFIASALLFWGAYKTTGMGSKALNVIAIILLVVWAWPRALPWLNSLGITPNIIMILAILVGIWMVKGGKGFLAWRMFLLIFLVACWIGAKGAVLKDSFNAFLASTGIELKMPNVEIPKTIKNITSGISGYTQHISAQKISQSKERLVKNGSTFYNYDGTGFTKKDFPSKEEFIKVFILDEQVTKDGLTFEKVRIGDPATGEDAWVYSGILLTSPKATTSSTSNIEGSAPEWEMVKDCPIHFSGRIFSNTVGPNGERANSGEIYSECFMEVGYDYKVTYSGTYSEFFVRKPWYDNISWQGWNPQSQGIDKPFPSYNYGALMLRIGNKESLHPESGKDFIVFTPTEAVKIFAELNINREDGEYYHLTEGAKLKNSTLSLKLERRPL
jgi:hypothetical protein